LLESRRGNPRPDPLLAARRDRRGGPPPQRRRGPRPPLPPGRPTPPPPRSGGPTLALPGALGGTAGGFDGVDDAATAPVNLSGTTDLTVEFWLKWNAFADDERLAMEMPETCNANP